MKSKLQALVYILGPYILFILQGMLNPTYAEYRRNYDYFNMVLIEVMIYVLGGLIFYLYITIFNKISMKLRWKLDVVNLIVLIGFLIDTLYIHLLPVTMVNSYILFSFTSIIGCLIIGFLISDLLYTLYIVKIKKICNRGAQ